MELWNQKLIKMRWKKQKVNKKTVESAQRNSEVGFLRRARKKRKIIARG